jgi:hypothetical protein
MSQPVTQKSTDHSDRERFSFSFFCDCCGKAWTSQITPFTAGGLSAIDYGEARQMLWQHEHKVAFEQANMDARLQFNRCSLCGRWVCNECFDSEGTEHGGICKECTPKE